MGLELASCIRQTQEPLEYTVFCLARHTKGVSSVKYPLPCMCVSNNRLKQPYHQAEIPHSLTFGKFESIKDSSCSI